MGTIDFPLTDGVHEESDNKLGKPSTLVQCENFYYELLGRLAQRGGFRGNATTDTLALATTGTPRHAVETADGLAWVSDEGMGLGIETNIDQAYQQGEAWYQASENPLALPTAYDFQGSWTGYNGNLITNADVVLSGSSYFASVGGVVFQSSDLLNWTLVYSAGFVTPSHPLCTLAAMTTGSGAGVFIFQGDGVSVNKLAISNGTTLTTTALGTPMTSACACPYGADAIIAVCDNVNIYLYHAHGSTIDLKSTWAHGLGGAAKVQIAADTVARRLYVGIQTAAGGALGKWAVWVIPNPATAAWTGPPGAAYAWPGGGTGFLGVLSFDLTTSGHAIVADTVSGAGTSPRFRKYNVFTGTEVYFPNTFVGIAGPTAAGATLVSRAFFVAGHSGFYFFAVADDYPNPGNALLLVHVDPTTNTSAYDGEICSVSVVQQYPMGVAGHLNNPDYLYKLCLSTPMVNADGSVTLIFPMVASTGKYKMNIGTYRFMGGTGGIRRSVAALGALSIASGGSYEMQSGLRSPGYTVCYATAAQSATAGSLAAGTYAVRALLEMDLPDGVWQGPASLPKTVALDGSHQLNAVAWAMWVPFLSSAQSARVVFYVAPPGSNTYYRSGAIDAYLDGAQHQAVVAIAQDIASVDTSGQVLYENYEPPRVYPGDCNGVSVANDRLWRWLGWRLWHTHGVSANQSTQWAGDDFRLDFDSDVQGVGQLQGQPVVITEKAVYLLEGDGPDRTGNGAYSVRTVASLPLGCKDQRSVLETPAGLMWASVRGIELLPPGGGVPQSVGQPVRQTYALGDYVLGAHSQARSLAVWFRDMTAAPGNTPSAICFDYLRGVWFTWNHAGHQSPLTAAFAWAESLGFFETDAVSTNLSYASFDAKTIGGANANYPWYTLDSSRGNVVGFTLAKFDTGDIRVSGTNANAIWRGVWMLGARVQLGDPSSITYQGWQKADGVNQTTQTFETAAGYGDQQWMRAMIMPPVSDCDATGMVLQLSCTHEYGPNVGQTPSITSLSFDYDVTGNQSRLGAGNRS